MKKTVLFIVLMVSITYLAFSQPVIKWQNTIGGNHDDYLNVAELTNDGGYILAGKSNSPIGGDKTENCWGPGSYDFWIIKLDASGNIEWQNTIGGTDQDELFTIQQTTDGGYIVGGHSYSHISGDKTQNNCSALFYADYWILKLDGAGNIEWQKTIGGDNEDWFGSIRQTTDGGYILGGVSYSGISCDKTENNVGNRDYWILKLDQSGNIQWQNSIGGSEPEWSCFVEPTFDGGYIVGGSSSSGVSGDKTEAGLGFGDCDIWILKLDALGNILWQNTISGDNHDWLRDIHQTSDGGYILGAYSESYISGDKTEYLSYEDYWILKLDTSGNIIWQNTIGGDGPDRLSSIEPTNDGGFIVGGTSLSDSSFDKTENNKGHDDYWMVKLDATGDVQWDKTIGGNGYDYFADILQNADGEYLAGGYSSSPISGDKAEAAYGSGTNDFWVMALTEKFNFMAGKVFYDFNSNSIQDSGEPSVANHIVKEANTGRFSFSESDGSYAVSVVDAGSFSVSPDTINYYTAVPSSYAIDFAGINEMDSLNDFALQPGGTFNDLAVMLTPLNGFNPGFNASYSLDYSNVGTTSLSGTIVFYPDPQLSYQTASSVPDVITPDSIVWNTGVLSPLQTGNILITLNVNSSTVLGSAISSGAILYPLLNDADTSNNSSPWDMVVTGSYDPNEILVNIHNIESAQMITPPYMEYIINFQNTGTDTAVNIKVTNKIPLKLDMSSFELMASSTPVELTFDQTTNKMVFLFSNILLPDSNVNEEESHGFIRYRIKPLPTLLSGDSIVNNASIFFDFNAPIKTNDAVTYIDEETAIEEAEISSSHLQLFPNPASQLVTIITDQPVSADGQLLVYDIYGREIYRLQMEHQQQVVMDVSKFADGIYIICLQANGKWFAEKIIKE
ncbi:MAG: T9SS type A sorting domain-containing protein [Chitinophagaceae bacterium]|nr:T9SS type A sorting domain-containing protein [Chitinophagaceae bacterium]